MDEIIYIYIKIQEGKNWYTYMDSIYTFVKTLDFSWNGSNLKCITLTCTCTYNL